MLNKVKMKVHRRLCFHVAISDQLQAHVNCNRAAGWFQGSDSMGGFVILSIATEWQDGLWGVIVWEVLLYYQLQQSGRMVCGECWCGRFSYVINCNRAAGRFKGSADMGVLSRKLVTWHVLDKGFFCNLKHYAYNYTEKYLKITIKLTGMCCQWSYVGFVNISFEVLGIVINTAWKKLLASELHDNLICSGMHLFVRALWIVGHGIRGLYCMWEYGRVQELSGDVEVFYMLECWGYCVVCYIVRVFGILNI